MAILNQKAFINVVPGAAPQTVVHLSQGNVGDTVTLSVYAGSEPFDMTGLAASVVGVRKDGTGFGPVACVISGGTVRFTVTSAMTALNGPALAEVTFTGSGGSVGSANFAMLIEQGTFANGPTYDTDISVYQQILQYVQSYPAIDQTRIDDAVDAAIAEEVTNRNNAIAAAVSAESSIRSGEDDVLRAAIASEASTRETAVKNINIEISGLSRRLETETSARSAEDSLLQSQIDQLVAPTGEAPSAAEVQNARIGADGTTYPSLGDAIRGQVGDLQTWLGDDCFYTQTRTARLMDISVNVSAGDVLYFKPVTWTGASFTAINMFGRKNNQDVSIATVSALGEDGFGVAKDSYTTIRIVVATASVPTSNQTMELYFRNLSTLDNVSQYTFRNTYDLTRTIKNGFSFNSASVPAPYNDLNTLPVGTVAAYTGTAAANTSNCPLRSWFIIMSYNQSSTNPASSQQVLTEVNTGVTFRRSYNGSWSEWSSHDVPMYVNSSGWHGAYKAYTTFKEGMEKAITIKNGTLYVDNGTYDILSEYGDDYLSAYNESQAFGCLIGNGLKVIFANGAKVVANYTGANDLVKQYFSPLNVTGDFELVNAKIEVQNVRYCVHEDINTVTAVPAAYSGKYVNCIMQHNGNSLSGWTSNFCIGAGASPGGYTEITGGRYTANNARHVPIFWHNYGGTGSVNAFVIIRDVVLGVSDHLHFRRSASAGNTVFVDVSGCLFGADITYADGAPDKFDIVAWNNTIRS